MSKKNLRLKSYRKLLLFIFALSLVASSSPLSLIAQRRAQQATQTEPSQFSPQLLRELKQIQQAALESDYALRQLAHLTNNIGPRLSGSPQAQQAVEYISGEMRRLGLEVKLEKVMVPHWVRGEESASLLEFPGQAPNTTQKVVLTALGGSVATPAEGITAEVVVVNNFDELTALGRKKVEGKIVLFNHKFDEQIAAQGYGGAAYGESVVYRGAGPSAAARLGAVAALVRSVGGLSYRLPHTGATRYAADAPRIPAAAVAAEDAEMMAYLTTQGSVRMRLVLTPQQLPDAESYNVTADLRGSEHPEQIIIVSGHLDSWDLGTGAIDDGAGVVMAMQTVQILKQLHLRPKRTIRFIAWMNEENGLMGGRTYAREYAGDVSNHVAAIESDRGAGHPIGFQATGKPDIIKILQPLAGILESSGAPLMRMTDDTEADVSPLSQAGVPAFALWQDERTYFDYHHTAADTFDKVNPRELAENAAVMSVLAYAIASIPQPLPR